MKARKVLAVMTALTMLTVSAAACSKDSSDEETEALDTEIETEISEETETESTFIEPEVAFDDSAYEEFAEPVYYDVIADAPAYADVGLNCIAMTYVQGSMVMGVATDGRYIVLDSGYVVDGQYLEACE